MSFTSIQYSSSQVMYQPRASTLIWVTLWIVFWLLLINSIPAQAAESSMLSSTGRLALASESASSEPKTPMQPSQLAPKQSNAERDPAFSAEHAARRARQRFGGRVLNVRLKHDAGAPYYRVKILEHGRVRIVDIDARH